MKMTISQIYNQALAVGFSKADAIIATAIALAESNEGDTQAKGVNTDGSIDRGLYQINNKWHSEVTDVCAYDPICATQQAYRISAQGKNFTQWSTFTNGRYKLYLDQVSLALQTGVSSPMNASITRDTTTSDSEDSPWYVTMVHAIQNYGLVAIAVIFAIGLASGGIMLLVRKGSTHAT